MPAPRPNLRMSRLAYALLFTAFVGMLGLALERTLRLEARMADQDRVDAEAALRWRLKRWEEDQLERIAASIRDIADAPVDEARHPPEGVDAVLVWQPSEDGQPGHLLYPPPALEEDIEALLADPCMVQAQARAAQLTDRLLLGRAWQECATRPAPVALLAVSRAADQFLAGGHPQEALAALQAPDLPLDPQPDLRKALGLSLSRVITRQLQLAEAVRQLGREDQARSMLLDVGRRIVSSEGPALDQVDPFLDYPVLADLRSLGAEQEVATLAEQGRAAHRRLVGYRELVERLRAGSDAPGSPLLEVQLPLPTAPDEQASTLATTTRVPVTAVVDPFGERRYLLALAQLPTGEVLALQLDPGRMLADFMREGPGSPLYVLDAEGKPVLPDHAAAGSFLATVPFGRLLPELRLATVDTDSREEERRALRSSQLVPITLGLIMAGLAAFAHFAADRQQRELWERQQAFVNRVSHELKTPLAGVKVMAELMEMGVVSDPDEVVQTSQRVITEVSRMEDRVNAILKQARRPEIQSRAPLDIRAMAEDLAEIWLPRFEQRGARLLVQLEDTPPVMGDAELIRDALSNLLDNALKYLREDVAGVVRLRTGAAGRWVYYEVTDNGIGVPEEMRRAIFERFTRVEGDGRGLAGGHGLGLAFVAEAVHGHGGKVECREGIAGGARFIIRLRRA